MTKTWAIDATMSQRAEDGLFCFCPIEFRDDGSFVLITGMNFLSSEPPRGEKLVAIVHEDGQDAVNAFCEKYKRQLDELK